VELVVATVSVEVPDPPADKVMLAGLKDVVGPVGETVAARLTFPANTYWLLRVMVDVEELPTLMIRVVGLADIR
jgi:hypothetical protein